MKPCLHVVSTGWQQPRLNDAGAATATRALLGVDPAAVHADVGRQLHLRGRQLAAKPLGRRLLGQPLDNDVVVLTLHLRKGTTAASGGLPQTGGVLKPDREDVCSPPPQSHALCAVA